MSIMTKWRCLLLLFFIVNCKCSGIVDLNGQWLLRDALGQYSDISVTVPGGIYSDLMDNNIIGDIFYGYNDTETNWVPRRSWIYYRNFTVNEELLNKEHVNLVFEGLDTFAEINVNNVVVGLSHNMFVRYIFDVKDHLKLGENELVVRFHSPITISAALAEDQEYVVPPTCPPAEYRGECNANMIRKMQSSFSWDWGPSFPSVGIWKDVHIESFQESKIRYIGTEISDDENNWYLDVDVYLSGNKKHLVEGALDLHLGDLDSIVNIKVERRPNVQGEFIESKRFTVPKKAVETWWPNGYGGQELYKLSAIFKSNNGDESTKMVRVGFRTVELIQESVGSGLSFYFKVNGLPIFMKGSNEIPLDILPERGQDRNLIQTLLGTAKYSNMNMLRIWGGGVYESDYFYDLADEYGILIWQDFMFACAMYPTDDYYLKNVIEEVRHQVNRLRSHPSIVLFAGNNENEGALRQSWYGTQDNFTVYYNDYVKLYIDTIQTEFKRITPNRIYLSSSPSNGKESISEGYVAQNPGDYNYGDVHFYNYVSDPWDSTIYPVTRFASEYGYQSLPSYSSLLQATSNPEDINIKSDFMDHRQHHPDGNDEMKSLIEFNLKLPDESHQNYSKAFIYYLQIAQAVGIKIETEHYRRYNGILNSEGLGHTMGALYWQLNDVWLAPTWSGIDFAGNWKMLQYFVKEFFSPNIITGHINNERVLKIYIVSDGLVDLSNVTASIKTYKWNSLNPVHTEELLVDVKSGKSNLIKSISTDQYLSEQQCGTVEDAKNNCFFYLSISNNGSPLGPNNYVFPAPLKSSNLVQPTVKIDSVAEIDANIFDITVSTDNVALFVWLETKVKGKFTENGFLVVNSTKVISFYSEENVLVDDLQNSLTITNLLDEQYL